MSTEPKHYLDPENWILPSNKEAAEHYQNDWRGKEGNIKSLMQFRRHLSPLDVYCYLKDRFGSPNGMFNILKSPTSDNLIHWDFLLKCEDVFICIMGKHRSLEILVNGNLNKEEWQTLVENFRQGFSSHAKGKSEEKNKLEEWAVFINRYSELCSEAEIHHDIISDLQNYQYVSPVISDEVEKWQKKQEEVTDQFRKLQQASLSLKMLTPIILEAFINFLILTTCKKEIREHKPTYEARIKEKLHIKVPSLHLTCDYFAKAIDTNVEEYKHFKRIMDNRNWFFHGNADPRKDCLEKVYFERNTPIFKNGGDVFEHFFSALIEMIQPKKILDDYIHAHEFILYVIECLDPKYKDEFWMMLKVSTLGFNTKSERFGILFPDYLVSSFLPGTPTDIGLFDKKE
ncbi:hypothetical protein RYZ26_19675 [Terasakiella sp. A23]|uniref:hypothetical protein n=1 Tax=Terasakiella sp. FCG-A23 TaxID=3080561 RepID=UPI002955CE34|nr:hypothetical protein [Terasakiella sp. A23]MDV7341825.1 hypothetical protein [Terasakiella sp. A23]